MEQFVQQIINATVFTPELLSWKLLLDDKINFLEHDIMAIDPDANEYDQTELSFEVLITLYFELIFNSILLSELPDLNDVSGFLETYKPNFTSEKFENLIGVLKDNFKKINIMISIIQFDVTDYLDDLIADRYCYVVFKEFIPDFFAKNEINKHYHMILNSKYKKTTELKDVYATLRFNSKIYQISFSKIIQ
jgi:hypothetical protein